MANYTSLAGHVEVGDYCIIGGHSAILQFVRLGKYAMIGGMTGVTNDVTPYGMVFGNRAVLCGLNVVGLKRHGFSKNEIKEIRRLYQLIFYNNDANFEQKGLLTQTKPTERCFKDITLGVAIERKISEMDIGQSLIIANSYVLGIEAIEGTDNLIKRCAPFLSETKAGVLVKIKKKNQEKKIDLPVIGENTIKNVHKANLAGIALEAGSSIIINKARVVEMADELGIFIIGI